MAVNRSAPEKILAYAFSGILDTKAIAPRAVLLLGIVGCGPAARDEPVSQMAEISAGPGESAPSAQTYPGASGNLAATDRRLVFRLSEVASTKVREAMASAPGSTHLVVSVDVDDEKYCTGFHYNLGFASNPARDGFVFTESKGVRLAIEADDVVFLDGTTLDYATLKSGEAGFVFRNPNENVSLPSELRDGR